MKTAHNKKYIIVGAGSKLFKRIEQYYPHKLTSYSTKEAVELADSFETDAIAIVFSIFDGEQQASFMNNLKCKSITVGSISALSKIASRFKYSNLKKQQQDAILKINSRRHKIVLFGDFMDHNKTGMYFTSKQEYFWQYVEQTIDFEDIVNVCVVQINTKDILSAIYSKIDLYLAPYSSYFLKKLSRRVYGYTDGSNYDV